jgi:uncharacterized protein (DUF433 family)
MLTAAQSVSVAEVAYMAGLTDRDINRLVDEDVLPQTLLWRDHGRRFAPLTAPLATFYFQASEDLTRSARVHVIQTITTRLRKRPDFDIFLTLSEPVLRADFDWSVQERFFTVFLKSYVEAASRRALRVSEAASHITEDPEILGGTPCFAGTRVPVANIVAAAEQGAALAELQSAYPFLTEQLLEDAQVYVKAHPRPGRPRRLAQVDPRMELVSRKVVRVARGAT